MNVIESDESTGTSSTDVSGSLTAAAGNVLLCVVAADADGVEWATPSGWSVIDASGYTKPAMLSLGAFYKVITADGAVNVTAVADTTCDNLAMHLLEVSPADGVGTSASNQEVATTTITWDPVAIARDGNLSILAVCFDGDAGDITAPTGYTEAQSTAVGTGITLVTYYDDSAKADNLGVTTTVSPAAAFQTIHIAPIVTVGNSLLQGFVF